MHENSTPGRLRMPAAGRGLALLAAGLACTAGLTAGSSAQAATRHRPLAAALAAGLEAVSADSASDAWAVGDAENLNEVNVPLTLHWNGTRWVHVKSPNPGGSSGSSLNGVTAVSATDAWAVGSYNSNAGANFAPLILHWNGTSWAKVAAPSLGGNGVLDSVSADSASDIWAAGFYNGPSGLSLPVLLHWNGTAWSQVTAPGPPSGTNESTLRQVKAISATDAWAAGSASSSSTGNQVPIVMHWDGTSWTQVTLPVPSGSSANVSAMAASSAANARAVGAIGDTSGSWQLKGSAWSQVTLPSLDGMALNGVDTRSATAAWAVGDYSGTSTTSPVIPLILRWKGTAWNQVTTPTLTDPGYYNILRAVTSVSGKNAWAVGYTTANLVGQQAVPIILHWNGTSWKQVKSPS